MVFGYFGPAKNSMDDKRGNGYQHANSDTGGSDSDDPMWGSPLMSRGPRTFKQGDVTKAIKAAVKAGARVARVEIVDGRIIVHVEEPSSGSKPAVPGGEWE